MHEQILKNLFSVYFNEDCTAVIQLPQAGSDRIYFRLISKNHSAVGTFSKDVLENEGRFLRPTTDTAVVDNDLA